MCFWISETKFHNLSIRFIYVYTTIVPFSHTYGTHTHTHTWFDLNPNFTPQNSVCSTLSKPTIHVPSFYLCAKTINGFSHQQKCATCYSMVSTQQPKPLLSCAFCICVTLVFPTVTVSPLSLGAWLKNGLKLRSRKITRFSPAKLSQLVSLVFRFLFAFLRKPFKNIVNVYCKAGTKKFGSILLYPFLMPYVSFKCTTSNMSVVKHNLIMFWNVSE